MADFGGSLAAAGELTATPLDRGALARAERAVATLEARVWATARYEDGAVRARLSVAVPYHEPDDGEPRASVASIDLADADSALADAFAALLAAHLPELVKRGRLGAAHCLVAAAAKGEV